MRGYPIYRWSLVACGVLFPLLDAAALLLVLRGVRWVVWYLVIGYALAWVGGLRTLARRKPWRPRCGRLCPCGCELSCFKYRDHEGPCQT